jgi:hypothetical protein
MNFRFCESCWEKFIRQPPHHSCLGCGDDLNSPNNSISNDTTNITIPTPLRTTLDSTSAAFAAGQAAILRHEQLTSVSNLYLIEIENEMYLI